MHRTQTRLVASGSSTWTRAPPVVTTRVTAKTRAVRTLAARAPAVRPLAARAPAVRLLAARAPALGPLAARVLTVLALRARAVTTSIVDLTLMRTRRPRPRD